MNPASPYPNRPISLTDPSRFSGLKFTILARSARRPDPRNPIPDRVPRGRGKRSRSKYAATGEEEEGDTSSQYFPISRRNKIRDTAVFRLSLMDFRYGRGLRRFRIRRGSRSKKKKKKMESRDLAIRGADVSRCHPICSIRSFQENTITFLTYKVISEKLLFICRMKV